MNFIERTWCRIKFIVKKSCSLLSEGGRSYLRRVVGVIVLYIMSVFYLHDVNEPLISLLMCSLPTLTSFLIKGHYLY